MTPDAPVLPAATAPARGTRPRNRRALIREAAGTLFAERGYAQVSLSDVAAAVNIGPSAIYRHYSSKVELLYDVVESALDLTVVSLPGLDEADLSELVSALAANILDHRLAGVLWQRESRHLPHSERVALGAKVRLAQQWLASELNRRRPGLEARQAELLAACCLDALTSVSFHHLSPPRPVLESLLTQIGVRVLAVDPNTSEHAPTARPRSKRRHHATRADALIDAALRLFAEHGYPVVTVDDIGAAVGIAGPSVYKHFDSKQDLLVAAMERGAQQLRADLDQLASEAASDEERLRRITATYVAFSLDQSDGVALLIEETIHLEGAPLQQARLLQRQFIDEWVVRLRACHPDESSTTARIKVQAAQMVANDLGRTPHLRNVPGFRQTVNEVCWAIQQ